MTKPSDEPTDDPYDGGLRRVNEDPQALARRLRQAGWRVAVVGEASRTRDFYRALADALELPPYFGANADALWDVLTDLTAPTAVVLTHIDTFAVARPERWRLIRRVLSDRAEQQPPFLVLLA